MQVCVQWNSVYGLEDFASCGDRLLKRSKIASHSAIYRRTLMARTPFGL